MLKYVWLAVLAIPPWAAAEFGAPKWLIAIAVAPFFLYAMTLRDPDEDMLGEASGKFRAGALVVMGVGGLVLGAGCYLVWKVLFPGA